MQYFNHALSPPPMISMFIFFHYRSMQSGKESIKLINVSVNSRKLCALGSISSPISLIET